MARAKLAGPSATEVANARDVGKNYDASTYEKPSVTCDCVIVTLRDGRAEVLLIQRGKPPYAGFWATPGGFIEMHEDLHESAARELQEETGVSGVPIEMTGVYGKPGRDPRTRVITVAWLAVVAPGSLSPQAADDARNVGWFALRGKGRPKMAFDHDRILDDALAHLSRRLLESPIARPLLPPTFTFADLSRVYAALGGTPIASPAALRATLLRNGVIRRAAGKARPARYAFVAATRAT